MAKRSQRSAQPKFPGRNVRSRLATGCSYESGQQITQSGPINPPQLYFVLTGGPGHEKPNNAHDHQRKYDELDALMARHGVNVAPKLLRWLRHCEQFSCIGGREEGAGHELSAFARTWRSFSAGQSMENAHTQ